MERVERKIRKKTMRWEMVGGRRCNIVITASGGLVRWSVVEIVIERRMDGAGASYRGFSVSIIAAVVDEWWTANSSG